MDHFTNKPCAIKGLLSYRYMGRYGFIMIGALDHQDALKQAQRSTRDKVSFDRLEFWNGYTYQLV